MSKFKKYRNKYTNNNIIHSFENILRMPVSDAFSKSAELNQQYNQIGFPTDAELNSSPNAVFVNAYTRDDGTQVSAHWRGVNRENGLNGVNSNPIPEQIQSGISMPTYPNGIFGLEHDIQDYQSDIPEYINNLSDESFAKAIINRIGVPSAQDGIFDGTFPSTLPQYGINSYGNTENPNPINDYTFQKSADYPYEETIPNYTDRLGNLLQGISNPSGINPVNNVPMSDYGYNNLQSFSNPQGQINTNIIQNSVDNQNDGEITHIFTPTPNPTFTPALSLLQGYVSETQPRVQQQPVQMRRENNPQVVPAVGNGENEYIRPYKQTGLHPVDFINSFGNGLSHGIVSLPMGLDKLIGNSIRKNMGLATQSDDEITQKYERAVGASPQNGLGYKSGNFLGRLIPFILIPEATILLFPDIVAMLIIIMDFAGILSDSTNSVGTSDKKALENEILWNTALWLSFNIAGSELGKNPEFRNFLKTLFNKLKHLYELTCNIIKMMWNLHIPVYVTVEGLRVFNFEGFFIFAQLKKEVDDYIAKVGKSGGSNTSKVYRKPDKVLKKYSIPDRKELQVTRLGQYNLTKNENITIDEIKSFEELNSALLFRNELMDDFRYVNYLSALKSGYITIYSTYPIKRGGYVSTSSKYFPKNPKTGKRYKRIVPIEDVAFMNVYEGRYAPIKHEMKNISNKPLQYKRKYVNNKVVYGLILPSNEKGRITHEINTHMVDITRSRKKEGKPLKYMTTEYIYNFINKDYDNYIFINKEINYENIHK